MKNLDYKSMLVGILAVTSFLLLIGQRSDGNLGQITVESIKIKGSNDKGANISILNQYGVEIAWIGETANDGGLLEIYNSEGNKTIYAGVDNDDVGRIYVNDKDGGDLVAMGNSGYGGANLGGI